MPGVFRPHRARSSNVATGTLTTTTAAPTTTTAAAKSTTSPATTTTAAPRSTTAPPATTSAAANNTTAPPATTSAAPGGSTTSAPSAATTAGGAPTTTTAAASGAPTFAEGSVTVAIDPDDGTVQNPRSIQVSKDAKLTLSWNATGAASVNIDPGALTGLPASGSQEIATQDATFTLVAIADGGAKSDPYSLDIHTHDAGTVVSPHVEVGAGVAAVLSFLASKPSGEAITSAQVGETITLTATLSEATEAANINGQSADLTVLTNGQKQAVTTVAIDASSDGNFKCEALKDGAVVQEQKQHIDIVPAGASASTTTHAPDGNTTQSPGNNTTLAPDHTTTHALDQTTTHGPDHTTTHAPGTTTTHAPATTTTHAPGTTTTHGAWTAAWSVETIKQDGTAEMVLTAPGLAAGTSVVFEISLDGGGTVGQITATSESGKATAQWSTWFKPELVTDQQTVGDGAQFKAVKFAFKASAGGQDATTTALITYSDKLATTVVDADKKPQSKTQVIIVSPWGTMVATTDDNGLLSVEGLPPGGLHLTID